MLNATDLPRSTYSIVLCKQHSRCGVLHYELGISHSQAPHKWPCEFDSFRLVADFKNVVLLTSDSSNQTALSVFLTFQEQIM